MSLSADNPAIKIVRRIITSERKRDAMTSQALNFIDLFAGAGGLSEGLTEAGFHGLFAADDYKMKGSI
jgi:hypothetical protein